MFKFLINACVTVILALLITNIFVTYFNQGSGFELVPLGPKFGTPPDSDATLTPVVHLATKDKKSFCTAFVVDANYAVTAAHCINHGGKLPKETLKLLDEKGTDVADAQAVGFHDRSDLGLLKGKFNKFLPLKAEFHNNGFEVRRVLAACGFPYGQHRLICNVFIPAMSGGPVIDPETGIAIGVNYAVGSEYSYISPLQGFLGVFGLE